MLVADLMTPDPLTLLADDTVDVAEEFMKFAHIRHLPVVDGGCLVGLVTHRDILRGIIDLLVRDGDADAARHRTAVPISRIMQREIATVDPQADARAAIRIMMEHKYGCLPVVEEEQLVGILTEADFLGLTLEMLDARESQGA